MQGQVMVSVEMGEVVVQCEPGHLLRSTYLADYRSFPVFRINYTVGNPC